MTKNFINTFEDLNVYQRAYKASLDIHKLSLAFPKIEQYALADQIRRSSKSICANIAEGFSKQRQSSAEFKRFLSIAMASSDEVKVWLNYAKDLEYLDEKTFSVLKNEYFEISKMLNGLMKSWQSKTKF